MDKLQIALVVCQGNKVILTGRAEFEKKQGIKDNSWIKTSTE